MTDPACRASLTAAAAEVAADGTDPELLVRVLAWVVGPRRSPDALRRRVRDGGAAGTVVVADQLAAVLGPRLEPDVAAVAGQILARWQQLGCRLTLVGDPAYPHRLAVGWPHLDAPPLLALRGDHGGHRPAVALVGSRRATAYGTGVTAWFAEAAADAGVRVVSGGAVGVDAAAHRAAAARIGGTTVVLGCGHGVGYPRPHARQGGLFQDVLSAGGATLSELLPEQPPRAGVVRARNRLVAALADVTVVVEGGERSGALLTAGAAAGWGRTVLAVPGDVRAPGSAAPHQLLADGAAPCTSPAELLDALVTEGLPPAGRRPDAPSASPPTAPAPTAPASTVEAPTATGSTTSVLPPEVHAALATAWPRPLRTEELIRRSGRDVGPVLAALTRAEVAGELATDHEGVRLRRAPPSSPRSPHRS